MQMAYSGRMTQRIYISFFLHLFSVASTHSTPAMLSLSTSSMLAVSVLNYPLSYPTRTNTRTILTPLPTPTQLLSVCSFGILKGIIEKLTLHELSKIFVEHALHVARIQFQTQAL